MKITLLCIAFTLLKWVSNKCCLDKFDGGWSCRYILVTICFKWYNKLEPSPLSHALTLVAVVFWFRENAGIHRVWMQMSSDVFPFTLLFGVLFLFRNHVSVSHPNKLQVVPNYAFSSSVYTGKNQSIPKFLNKDIPKEGFWTRTCSMAEIHEAVIIRQETLKHLLSLSQNWQNAMHAPYPQSILTREIPTKIKAIAPSKELFSWRGETSWSTRCKCK